MRGCSVANPIAKGLAPVTRMRFCPSLGTSPVGADVSEISYRRNWRSRPAAIVFPGAIARTRSNVSIALAVSPCS
jgi:hypothetical protein